MYKLINGRITMVVYSEKDRESYVNSGWKLVEENNKKKKKVQENADNSKSEQTEFTEGI